MKDNEGRIVVIAGEELKESFRKACDGRTMSHVLISLMNDYIKKHEGEE